MDYSGRNFSKESFWDQKSFRLFFDQYYAAVYRRLFALLGDQTSAEELCQDIFISLWQRRFELPNVIDWNHYLMKAATFKAIDFRRKGKGILQFVEDFEAKEIISEEEITDENHQLERLDKEISALPDRCQLIFKLSRFEQMSYSDIAKVLEISSKTVENQIGKALKILRKNLLPQLFVGALQFFQ
jgi:RNA polymerase sigma-70 factor (ECF subfamily)